MLWVVALDKQQFVLWCRSRGWQPNDRGIRFLNMECPESFQGIHFQPGDLVIRCEHYRYLTDRQAESYDLILKLTANSRSDAIGIRYDKTLGN